MLYLENYVFLLVYLSSKEKNTHSNNEVITITNILSLVTTIIILLWFVADGKFIVPLVGSLAMLPRSNCVL